jgi:hypothetical protein
MGFSVDPVLKLVGVGSLIRDTDGSVMVAMNQKLVLCDDTLQLQATVVLVAVKFAFHVGFRSLDVDMSYNELYYLLQFDGPCLAPIGALVDDILQIGMLVLVVSSLLSNLLVTRQHLPWLQRRCPQLPLRRGLITALGIFHHLFLLILVNNTLYRL